MYLTNTFRYLLACSLLIGSPAIAAEVTLAEDMHPMMNDKYWINVGVFSGRVWNGHAGINFRLSEHFGIGLNYQLFEIDGRIRETYWRGSFRSRLTGPNVHITAHW